MFIVIPSKQLYIISKVSNRVDKVTKIMFPSNS